MAIRRIKEQPIRCWNVEKEHREEVLMLIESCQKLGLVRPLVKV